MSFLKGMALDYFKPFLDTPDDKPAWLKDYELFIKELLINFSLYNALADAEAELNALIMKDNHKATRFFINFFRLSMLCDYNDRALLQKAYSMLPKRVKDKMTHFDHPSTLQELRDLVLRIDQRYWECCRGSIKNKAIFFFNWPHYFSIFSHCLRFQKTQKQEKSRITT